MSIDPALMSLLQVGSGQGLRRKHACEARLSRHERLAAFYRSEVRRRLTSVWALDPYLPAGSGAKQVQPNSLQRKLKVPLKWIQ